MMIEGLGIACDVAGPAGDEAVVFVHAGVADRRMWEHQFRALSARWRVVRYDWRGQGESADPVGEVCHHEDLLAVLDALGVRRAVLAGCSMGGAYAVEAALAAPERVAGLALFGSGLAGHVWPASMLEQARERVHGSVPAERLARYRRGGVAEVDRRDVLAYARAHTLWQVAGPERGRADLSEEVWESAVEMCAGVFARLWGRSPVAERFLAPPAAGRLGEVAVPAVVVNGLADVAGIQEVSGVLAAGIGGARRVDLPRTGHLAPLERPVEVAGLLEGLVEEVSAGGW
ncbi:alpha/beta fold hydrolase [Nonomuraea sp. NPDC050691]|uniref:alpha/beta fold hydrolase n=1 Tax=Nonomuraea sp. NPDC050691 TaxID=3155661 RepID=UPI0033CD4E99